MIRTAAAMLPRRGLHGTGLVEVTKACRAPRGSIYHHFPGGKDELVAEALKLADAFACRMINESGEKAGSPSELFFGLAEILARWMMATQFNGGCPVTAVTLAGPPEGGILESACRQAYENWKTRIAAHLKRLGAPDKSAEKLAHVSVIGFEGALILSRAERSPAAFYAMAEATVSALNNA